jgi:hypothetical protein
LADRCDSFGRENVKKCKRRIGCPLAKEQKIGLGHCPLDDYPKEIEQIKRMIRLIWGKFFEGKSKKSPDNDVKVSET